MEAALYEAGQHRSLAPRENPHRVEVTSDGGDPPPPQSCYHSYCCLKHKAGSGQGEENKTEEQILEIMLEKVSILLRRLTAKLPNIWIFYIAIGLFIKCGNSIIFLS